MGKVTDYFDLENEYKGWEPFIVNKQNVKNNKGRNLLYVNRRTIDPYRGYYSIDYAGNIEETYYSMLMFEGGNNSVDKRDIVACIIDMREKESIKDEF
jgi:hypothetical protein